MGRVRVATAALLSLALSCAAGAAAPAGAPGPAKPKTFKPYPGASEYKPPDTEETKVFTERVHPGLTLTAYLTHDSMAKVVAFYHGTAQQFPKDKKFIKVKLPNGTEIQKTFMIFDGADTVAHSSEWIAIQHPFVGPVTRKDDKLEYGDIRDVTEIVLTEKVPVEKKDTEPGNRAVKVPVQSGK
jgi:hypothetical protein